jgi:hypothetical protein
MARKSEEASPRGLPEWLFDTRESRCGGLLLIVKAPMWSAAARCEVAGEWQRQQRRPPQSWSPMSSGTVAVREGSWKNEGDHAVHVLVDARDRLQKRPRKGRRVGVCEAASMLTSHEQVSRSPAHKRALQAFAPW